ncbi:acetyl/propionyl/methylcrotonyl-CoA carboxylase subunit alpha [Aestuariispira ectoiniformans]|uniref:acetyl/propionyl/methylcrotonyl-CoA carboxylase subunit alpha n=1 Tax=Aestuariispira ectoiniformans TaxID=2775080 RepID=UPI00223BCCEC|nr:acetyl/propionyl/methylcrotonyl-CoA carboxylase subunit alpha [Aestuariispira ectoiniformans]
MFKKILIANRGEIACRVIETAREMAIGTVAVYSDADAKSKHVALADEAVHIGPPAASESYLLGQKIIDVALETGAQAIHPGYGFLSENAEFADACARAGLVFIGPPADAIRAMGSKSEAKAVMGDAGVPLVPGYHGDNQDAEFLHGQADEIGYPLLIKASAGGGGKGMRLVEKSGDFAASLESCRREARNSFGDDHVLLERFVTRPRHIEMQIFADSHGNAVHLFERDCSVQRRHQKVLEEAPAPGMSEDLRKQMGDAAVAAAKAIGYEGAGTVEFIVETDEDSVPGAFFFMEMNTRLQVEHPVTEMVTDQDLVEWQLRVAAGEVLPLLQDQINCSGHAIEARLYAEDPDNDFLPAIGTLHHLHLPEDKARIDSGVRSGDEVSMHYDPMIAKIIVHGRDRNEALRRMESALQASQIAGVTTNRDFLAAVVRHPAFANAQLNTGFIANYEVDLLPEREAVPSQTLALAVVALLQDREAAKSVNPSDPWSPWNCTDNWRLNDSSHTTFHFDDAGVERQFAATIVNGSVSVSEGGESHGFENICRSGAEISAVVDGRRVDAVVHQAHAAVTIVDGMTYRVNELDPMRSAGEEEGGSGRLTAPMPGKVTAVHVAAGDTVTEGQALLILEAMKMEHTIVAPIDGIVASVRYAVGDQVAEGQDLVTFEEEA